MKKRTILVLILGVLLTTFIATNILADVSYGRRAQMAKEYSFGERQTPAQQRQLDENIGQSLSTPQATGREGIRSSLGSSSPSASAGLTVENSYVDWQYFSKGRHVDYRGTPSVHFAYMDQSSSIGGIRYGYNVYDPVGGSWPRGLGIGCEVQAADGGGYYANLDVTPQGYVVLAGHDDASGNYDNHMYYQTSTHSCFWSSGTQIPKTSYGTDFHNANKFLQQVVVEFQVFGSDTVTHVVGVEDWGFDTYWQTEWRTLVYSRKVGAGTWTSQTIDTVWGPVGDIASSRVSGKVAITYPQPTAEGLSNGVLNFDADVWYRESSDLGVTWGPPINATNYSPTVPGHRTWWEISALYDSQDFLHLVFNSTPAPANLYDVGYSLALFINGSSLFHWTDKTGLISRIHNAEWGTDNVPDCWGGNSTTNMSRFQISECNGRLYTIWTMFNDATGSPPILNDCHSSANGIEGANGEIYLSVSTTLDGTLWDAYRNLTNSYTPDCDSAGFGGDCSNDEWATMSKYGMDESAFGTLTWPGAELVDPTPAGDPPYSGTNFLHVFYVEDRWPSLKSTEADTKTSNPLNWMRLACVDPVVAPQITSSESSLGYPSYVSHGSTDTASVTITNDGNAALTVTSIGTAETSGPSGWLAVSSPSLTVNAGASNTATFDIRINENGLVNTPGTIVALNGEVYLLSDAGNTDSLSIAIVDYLVADTVIGLAFDTLATAGTLRGAHVGDYVRLAVNNVGAFGGYGDSKVGLDFSVDGGECDTTATTYVFNGGPLVIREDSPGNYTMSNGMFQNTISSEFDFRRVDPAATGGPVTGANYDGYQTGRFVNKDSTIGVEREFLAPTGGGDSTDFVILRTMYYSLDGNSHSNLVIGEGVDFDVPSDDGATNLSGIMTGYNTVYQQGNDTATVAGCQLHGSRYATYQLLGYYSSSEFNGDSCANTCVPYGTYAGRNDSLLNVDDSVLADWMWNRTLTRSGLSVATTDVVDQHLIMSYVHGYTLAATDTFVVYSVLTSVHEGTITTLEENLDAAFSWYGENLRPGCTTLCGCCVGITGNVDNDAGEIVDIGDLTALIGFLFIPPNTPPVCMEEANTDGDAGGVVDIGDLTALIGFLFIPPNTPPAACQ